MRKLLIGAVVAVVGATAPGWVTASSVSSPAHFSITVGQSLDASYFSPTASVSLFGTTGNWISDQSSSVVSTLMNGCVQIIKGDAMDSGCGPFTVTIDPLLSSGTATGTLHTGWFTSATGGCGSGTVWTYQGPSTITFTVSLTGGSGIMPPVPYVNPYTSGASAGVYASASLSRSAAGSGSLTSAVLGQVSGPLNGVLAHVISGDAWVQG